MKKSIITSLLIVLISMIEVNVSAHDIEVANADGVTIYYNWTNNNTELAVTYRGNDCYSYTDRYSGNVVIPESVEDNGITYKVTSIGGSAFASCSSLTSVTIPNSVTSIGGWAFCECSGLTSITIPNSVISISEDAFAICSSLTSVTIPNSVTSIGNGAFWGCTSLTSVTIPNSVTSIGGNAFQNCSELTSVHISDLEAWCKIVFYEVVSNPLFYAQHLFLNGEEIKDLVIPHSVTSIGEYAFWGCSSLISVTIPNSVTSIGGWAFCECSGLTSVTIGNSVTYVGSSAFFGCSSLTSVTIPNSVTSIGERAFSGCTNMKSVTSKITEPYSINNNVFTTETYRQATLYIPVGTEKLYTRFDGWREFLNIVEKAGDEKPIYLTIQNGASGRMKLAVKANDHYTWQIQPSSGVEIKSVYFNDQDVTSQLDAEKYYTTPPIKENSTLRVEYEGDPRGSDIDGDTNGDGEVNVADVDYIIERIK